MVRFSCPGCGKVYKAAEDLAGRQAVCKNWGVIAVIPGAVDGGQAGPARPADGVAAGPPGEDHQPPAHHRPAPEFDWGSVGDRDPSAETWAFAQGDEGRGEAQGVLLLRGGAFLDGRDL